MLFALGFIVLFVLGGLTGVMVASVPFDQQAHDTYFVVAHLHYVQIGAFVFPLFAAFYYWFPKITGRMLSEKMGKLNFWLFFIGINVTFFPMHFLGMMGMTRRVYTYLPETGWGPLNFLATVGAAIIAISMLCFVINVFRSLRSGELAGDDPWNSHTLEWATTSPPPRYNFLHIPIVHGLHSIKDHLRHLPVVTGLRTDRPEILVTTLLDGEPDSRHAHPGPSIWPFVVSLMIGVMFISGIFTPWGFVIGPVIMFPPMVAWLWERYHRPAAPPEETP
jgi:cytochrome c oxidase subunit 1